MKIFLHELATRHRANVRALFQRHTSWIGYLAVVLGFGFATYTAETAIHHADERSERIAGAICENTKKHDREQILNLVTKQGHELIAQFHLTLAQATVIVHRGLAASAAERRALAPSKPASACSPSLTTLERNNPTGR